MPEVFDFFSPLTSNLSHLKQPQNNFKSFTVNPWGFLYFIEKTQRFSGYRLYLPKPG